MANEDQGASVVERGPKTRVSPLAGARPVAAPPQERPAHPPGPQMDPDIDPEAVEAATRAAALDPKVQGEIDLVYVYPLKTDPRVRIGPEWYAFEARKRMPVPRYLIPHLIRCGIIAPPME